MPLDGLHVAAKHSAAGYDEKNSLGQQLSLLVKGHHLYVSISDASSKTLLHLEKWTLDTRQFPEVNRATLDQVFRSQPILQRDYGETRLAFWTPWYTFVPGPFVNGHVADFLNWQLPAGTEVQVREASLNGIEGNVCYGMEPQVASWAQNHFDKAQIQHSVESLLAYLSELNAYNGKTKVYAYVTDRLLEVIVFDKNRFHLYNAYTFHEPEDFLYFVTLAFQQLGLDPESDVLVLAGEITQEGRLYTLLYRYFRNIQFTALPERVQLGSGLEPLDNHYYLHLMMLI